MLTYWVLDTVAAELGDWLRANPDARLSINVPPEILGRGGMAYVATKSGLAEQAAQIILEVTERGLPDLLGVESINQGSMGTSVALDDVTFAGAANLAVLARCNFSAIKLDKSLIDQIEPGTPCPHVARNGQGAAGVLAPPGDRRGGGDRVPVRGALRGEGAGGPGLLLLAPARGGGVPGVSSRLQYSRPNPALHLTAAPVASACRRAYTGRGR